MNGLKPAIDVLGRLLQGALDSQTRRRMGVLLDDSESDARILVDGLKELPTSFLGIALKGFVDIDAEAVYERMEAAVRPNLAVRSTEMEINIRKTVDDVFVQTCGSRYLNAISQREFYLIAGEALAATLATVARREISGVGRSSADVADETASMATLETTVSDAYRRPHRVLVRDDRLRRLQLADASLASVYVLVVFAGRSVEEASQLLGLSRREVEEALEVAQVEVCLDD